MQKSKTAMWGWLMQRVTGVLLIIGLIVHYLRLHFFTHGKLDEQIVSAQIGIGWLIFDICLLGIALYHGFYGVLGIFQDYNPSASARESLFSFCMFIGIVLFILGSLSLITFAGYSII